MHLDKMVASRIGLETKDDYLQFKKSSRADRRKQLISAFLHSFVTNAKSLLHYKKVVKPHTSVLKTTFISEELNVSNQF